MDFLREKRKDVQQREDELNDITNSALQLATMAKTALGRSVWALCERSAEAARQVLRDEGHINALTDRISADCLSFIGNFQPAEKELRRAASIMLMARDMERIGDYGKKIASESFQLLEQEPLKPLIDIPAMSRAVEGMLDLCVEALNSSRAELALSVFPIDDTVDDLEEQIFRELLFMMIEQPSRIERAWRLLGVARILERAGDHATNIAEHVYFICSGKRVHASEHRRPRRAVARNLTCRE